MASRIIKKKNSYGSFYRIHYNNCRVYFLFFALLILLRKCIAFLFVIYFIFNGFIVDKNVCMDVLTIGVFVCESESLYIFFDSCYCMKWDIREYREWKKNVVRNLLSRGMHESKQVQKQHVKMVLKIEYHHYAKINSRKMHTLAQQVMKNRIFRMKMKLKVWRE